MLNKIFLKMFGVLDLIKDFLIVWGIKILIVIFTLIIMHNIVKISEISSRYQGDYKSLTPIYEEEKKFMNYYETGEGPTVVILPEFGSQSPVIQYKTLVDGLKDNCRVVVVEYFGYGFSMSMSKHERTNDIIVEEIKKLLDYREIYGPYIFVAADTSSIYAMRFQYMYPELVSAIVSIDSVYPAESKDNYRIKAIRDRVANVNINSIWELTGFERILSYTSPKTFYIDKMKALPDNYGDEELSVYRNRIGSNYLSRTMVREANKLEENMKQMENYIYPDYLPTLQILSSEKRDTYVYAKNSKESEVDLEDLANDLITNHDIQKVEVVQGDDHMLQLSNPSGVIQAIRNFIGF
jgi:pimeloyl-ACP methyl ester carboxylesterase